LAKISKYIIGGIICGTNLKLLESRKKQLKMINLRTGGQRCFKEL